MTVTQEKHVCCFQISPAPPPLTSPLSAGAMFGNGAYFAVDPAYSARGYAKPDTQGHRRMYLARVLVGDFTKGQQGLVAPPARDPARPSDLYDSVSDKVAHPSMFVIFNDVQAYPEFLITFT